jgi:hypothetical protein
MFYNIGPSLHDCQALPRFFTRNLSLFMSLYYPLSLSMSLSFCSLSLSLSLCISLYSLSLTLIASPVSLSYCLRPYLSISISSPPLLSLTLFLSLSLSLLHTEMQKTDGLSGQGTLKGEVSLYHLPPV